MIATKKGGCRDSGVTFQRGVTDPVVPWGVVHVFGAMRLWLFMQSSVQLLRPHGLYSLPGFSGISQARILDWFAISSSRGSSLPRDGTCISHLTGRFFTTEPPGCCEDQ